MVTGKRWVVTVTFGHDRCLTVQTVFAFFLFEEEDYVTTTIGAVPAVISDFIRMSFIAPAGWEVKPVDENILTTTRAALKTIKVRIQCSNF